MIHFTSKEKIYSLKKKNSYTNSKEGNKHLEELYKKYDTEKHKDSLLYSDLSNISITKTKSIIDMINSYNRQIKQLKDNSIILKQELKNRNISKFKIADFKTKISNYTKFTRNYQYIKNHINKDIFNKTNSIFKTLLLIELTDMKIELGTEFEYDSKREKYFQNSKLNNSIVITLQIYPLINNPNLEKILLSNFSTKEKNYINYMRYIKQEEYQNSIQYIIDDINKTSRIHLKLNQVTPYINFYLNETKNKCYGMIRIIIGE